MKLASRGSRPGLVVGLLRILCNGLCIAQRLHHEENEQTCRIGCPDEPDSLSHYNECPQLYNIFSTLWRHAQHVPRRGHLLHDLSTHFFVRSLQYGIIVLGIVDAFVYAHNQHRCNTEDSGNFGDCMEGRIRFMTAITPSYAHAYQVICLTRRMPDISRFHFRLPKAKARYPHLPDVRSTTLDRGGNFQVAFILMAAPDVLEVKISLDGELLHDHPMDGLPLCSVQ